MIRKAATLVTECNWCQRCFLA